MASLSEVINQALGKIYLSKSARHALDGMTGDDVETVACSRMGTEIVALTSQRLLVADRKKPVVEYDLADLHSVSVLDSGSQDPHDLLLCPLQVDQPFYGVPVGPRTIERIAAALRARLSDLHSPGTEWWDNPSERVGQLISPFALLVAPPDSQVPMQYWYSLSIVNTGVQLRTTSVRNRYPGDQRQFFPWSAIRSLSPEGDDNIQRRHSVAAVLAVGVLGLAAGRDVRRSWLVIGVDSGEYVLENQQMLSRELSGLLSPITRNIEGQTATESKPARESTDPLETIRQLGELRDRGFLTPEEFEAKKADLLKRI
jgi:hypothetical protein